MNSFGLIMLQKRIADELKVEVGSYTLRANSFHYYEKNKAEVENAAEQIFLKNIEKLTYSYADDWKELMDEECPKVMAKVEELKNRGNY